MSCNLETLLIDKSDFDCIGQVSKTCSWDQLCIYIREQQNLFLLPKIGYSILKLIKENHDDSNIQKLLCGGEYIGCNGSKKYQFGLKRVLVHASYAAYIYRHGYVDTPFGVVQKMHKDSIPAPLTELKGIKNENYTNAELYYEGVEDYLCSVKSSQIFANCENFSQKKCNTCSGTEEKKEQRRQYSFSNVIKK
jgi:hypothetical protein